MSASKTTRSQLSKMQWETFKAIYFAQKPMAWNMRSETIRSLQRRGLIATDKTGQVIATEAGRQLMDEYRRRHESAEVRQARRAYATSAQSTSKYIAAMNDAPANEER